LQPSVIYGNTKTNTNTIWQHLNNYNKDLILTPTLEDNSNIKYLDLAIHRTAHSLQLGIHRKPTHTDTTIHYASTHPLQHKLVAYRYFINRMLTLPITNKEKMKEWSIIQNIAHKNGFPPNIIRKLLHQIENTTKTHVDQPITNPRAWVTFTFNSPGGGLLFSYASDPSDTSFVKEDDVFSYGQVNITILQQFLTILFFKFTVVL
jgi:hypothetical protein